MHTDYEDINTATGAEWSRQDAEADRIVDARLQAEMEARLTDAERQATVEALSRFVITAGAHIRHGGLTAAGIEQERAAMLAGSRALEKLRAMA